MVLPLAYIAGVASAAAANLAVEYAIAQYRGEQLSQQDVAETIALGVIPGLGMGKHSLKIGSMGKGIIVDRRTIPKSAWSEIGMAAVSYGRQPFISLTKIGTKSAVYRRVIHSAYEPSRAVVRSLTSSTKRPGTTTRVPGAKRSRSLKSGSKYQVSRRRTTYCKKHLRYDFCKYYNK